MTVANPHRMMITVDDARRVSGLLQAPPQARMCYALAHGAGAGMAHPLMAAVAEGLAGRGIATLRYQSPCVEQLGARAMRKLIENADHSLHVPVTCLRTPGAKIRV